MESGAIIVYNANCWLLLARYWKKEKMSLVKILTALNSELKDNEKSPENKSLAYFERDYFYPPKVKKMEGMGVVEGDLKRP